jgi:hypothetical protein
MVDIKTSAQAAVEFFNSIYPRHMDGLQVEEVELSDDGQYWVITLGYNVPNESSDLSGPLGIIPRLRPREYKTFKIDRETGEVKSMKIRKV